MACMCAHGGCSANVTLAHLFLRLALQSKTADGDRRPIELYMCSIMMKMGYAEGFKWLGERI